MRGIPMKAQELVEILMGHPDREVVICCPETIEDIDKVEIDCFDEEQGLVFVIIPEGDDE